MAKKTKRLSVHLTDREQVWALMYLLFSLCLLPQLLSSMNVYLPTPLNDLWINFLYFTVNFLFVFWIFAGFFRRSLIYAGQHMLDFLAAVLLGSVFYWCSSWGVSRGIQLFFPDFVNLNDGNVVSMVQDNFALMFIATVVFVPVAEEALHRGLVFGCLYPKNHAAAYVLSIVIFAAIHILGYVGLYSPLQVALAFVQYVPAGFSLAWAYRRSGSIFAPMLMHAVINAIGMLAQR